MRKGGGRLLEKRNRDEVTWKERRKKLSDPEKVQQRGKERCRNSAMEG